jgi:hypothetical protein
MRVEMRVNVKVGDACEQNIGRGGLEGGESRVVYDVESAVGGVGWCDTNNPVESVERFAC